MMITGITVLALAFFTDELRAMDKPRLRADPAAGADASSCRQALLGLLLAGLLAAFMSNFRGHDQRGAGVHRERHLQAVHQSDTPPSERTCE